jgi:polyisoprenyl-phosphate glycosyltransferase
MIQPKSVKILIPLYNDWESLYLLIRKIESCVSPDTFRQFSFLVVNDCSYLEIDTQRIDSHVSVEVLHLSRNMGHQKAIAIGLAYLHEHDNCQKVIVMDSDGEDRPEDLENILTASVEKPNKIIFAQRLKRQEGFAFRFFYKIYKLIFQIFTGKSIAFGNFCIIPSNVLHKVVYVSEIWNHFSGGIIRSKLPYDTIPLNRGKRLAGESKMNFSSLILHGLGAVSVHLDTVAVRLLLFFIGLIVIATVGILMVLGVKFFSPFNIPNVASIIVVSLMIVLAQAFMVCLFLVFMVLTYRTHIHFVPALQYKDFILNVEKIHK